MKYNYFAIVEIGTVIAFIMRDEINLEEKTMKVISCIFYSIFLIAGSVTGNQICFNYAILWLICLLYLKDKNENAK